MTTVLIVDDLTTERRLAGGLIQKNQEWNVLFACDGKEAMQQIELHLPDIVLTDLQMPGMNGLELVEAVRRDYPLIPVILMTARGSEEIAVQALHHGAASYVPKRRLAQDLIETVERVLSAAREDRGLARVLNRMVQSNSTFVLENDVTLLQSLAAHLRAAISGMRICERPELLRVGIALEEALLNAYYHGNLELDSSLRETDYQAYYALVRERSQMVPYRDRQIHVAVQLSRDEVAFSIRDEGPGFDISKVPDPTDPENLDRPCGRGLLLIRTFMDEVIHNAEGNEIRLIKRRANVAANSETVDAP